MEKDKVKTTAQTRSNLKDAYWALLKNRDGKRITIKNITDKAGYNRGTFYIYYSDIEHLKNEMEEELLPTRQDFEKMKASFNSDEMDVLLERFIHVNKEQGDKLEFLMSSTEGADFQNKLQEQLKKFVFQDLEKNEKQNEITAVDLKLNILSVAFLEIVRYWYGEGKNKYSESEMAKIVADLFKNILK